MTSCSSPWWGSPPGPCTPCWPPGWCARSRAPGVINFAHGALAMYPAYTLNELQKTGDFFLPWFDFIPGPVDLPVRISVADGPIAFFPADGHRPADGGVPRRPRPLPGVPARCATPRRSARWSGRWASCSTCRASPCSTSGPPSASPGAVLPSEPLDGFLWFDRPLPRVNLWLVGICVIVGVVLWYFYRSIRTGIATRAAAGNEKGAILLGYSPERLAAHQLDDLGGARRHRRHPRGAGDRARPGRASRCSSSRPSAPHCSAA